MPANSRRPLMSGNWKMNMNHYEAIHLVQKLSYLLTKEDFEKWMSQFILLSPTFAVFKLFSKATSWQ